jgi:hypothetical protein
MYVGAWLIGLAVNPAGVTAADGDAMIVASYVGHRVVSIVQILFVHVIAAAALTIFAIGVSHLVRSSGGTRTAQLFRRTSWAVVAISLLQAVVGLAMIVTAGTVASSTTRDLLLVVQRLDALKLLGLAAVCTFGVVFARRRIVASWTGRVATAAIVFLLPAAVALSGLAATLTPTTVPALLLLLVWVGSVGFVVRPMGA